MRVLLLEDDPAMSTNIQLILTSAGFVCDATGFGEDGLEIGKLYDYDIVLLDLMLPDMDGYRVLGGLRAARVKTPVLILSGLSGIDDKIKALDAGADDYLTKPFDKRELIARIQAVVRRSKGYADSVIRTGTLVLDLDSRTVELDGRRVQMTPKEHKILVLLSQRKGMVLSKEIILDHLYGGLNEPELKIVHVFVCRLRKKLSQASGGKNYIETVWGRGYVLREPPPQTVEDHAANAAMPEHVAA